MKNQCRDQRKERRDNHEMAYALLSLSESRNGNGNFKINDGKETENHEMAYVLLSLSESHNGNGNFKINGSKETESSETDNKSPNCEDVEENDPVNHSIDVIESNRLSDELCGKTDISILEDKIKDLQTEGDHYKNLCEELSKKVNDLEKQNIYYKNLMVVQTEEIAKLKSALENNSQDKIDSAIREGIEKILSKLFTEGQIKLLLSGKKRVKEWSGNDIASAISLRSVSPKAYRYLRQTLHFPLPGASTLCRYAATFSVKSGLQESVLQLMKYKGVSLSDMQKITALSFDEMYLCPQISFDRAEERILGPHKRVQVVMARGLCSDWKQPVFYEYDFDMTVQQLFAIISALHYSGYDVVSTTCDMGTSNVGLWKQLQVSHTDSSFSHCVTNDPVAVFADVPHALKNARNHYIDHGFLLDNSTFLGKSLCESLLSIQTSDLKIGYKISANHLQVTGPQRQNVQLFSNNTASAIEFCGMNGLITSRNWKEGADMIKMFNDWFDIHNSSTKYDKCETRNAFGTNIDKQLEKLDKMDDFMKTMRVHKKRSLLPFQKGILMSNMSLRNLYNHLVSKYKIEYIFTRRLNQDVAENTFSYLRGMSGRNDHPNALSFKHRLRWYVLGKHSSAVFTQNKNTEDNTEDTCVTHISDNITSEMIQNSELVIEENELESCYVEEEINTFDQSSQDLFMSPSTEDYELLNEFELHLATENYNGDFLEEEALRYVAGYVAHRFSHKCPNLAADLPPLPEVQNSKHDWISFISKGKLTHPSAAFVDIAKILEVEFKEYHGDALNTKPGIITDLVNIVKKRIPKEDFITDDALKCLVRTRTFIRLRILNKNIRIQLQEKKNKRQLKKFKS